MLLFSFLSIWWIHREQAHLRGVNGWEYYMPTKLSTFSANRWTNHSHIDRASGIWAVIWFIQSVNLLERGKIFKRNVYSRPSHRQRLSGRKVHVSPPNTFSRSLFFCLLQEIRLSTVKTGLSTAAKNPCIVYSMQRAIQRRSASHLAMGQWLPNASFGMISCHGSKCGRVSS